MQSRSHLSFLPWYHSWKTYQVRFLKSVGIRAEFIGEEQRNEEAKQSIERGESRSFSARLKRFCQAQDGDQC